jgi:chemotaxis protein methyltransferase CheR
MRLADEVCHRARDLIARRLGLDFPEGRRADLERGLLSACRTASVPVPETYLAWLTTLPAESQEWRRLASHLTVGETYFFRDPASLAALEQHVLPSLIAAHRAMGILQLRLWSAGCATGEEPYSLAMLLDRLLPDRAHWQVTILATDLNPVALEMAQRGLYRAWSFRETPAWLQKRYFCQRSAGTFELDPQIRQMVSFVPCNLAKADALTLVANASAMDVILCRNVLIYFTRAAQRVTVAQLQRALVPGGWLVVGAVEASAELLQPLVPITFPGAILYRKEPSAAPSVLPSWQGATVVPNPPGPLPSVERSGSLVTSQSSETGPPVEQTKDLSDSATALQHARALADQGHLESARDLCEAVLARDRLDTAAYLLLAAIHHERGVLLAALEALRRAIYLAPDCAPAHFLLGSLLLQQGEYHRGRHSMETVIRLLRTVPLDEVVPNSDGLTAGRLLEMARLPLESG